MMGSPRWAGICMAYDNMYVSPVFTLLTSCANVTTTRCIILNLPTSIFGYLFMKFLLLLCDVVFVILSCII